MSCLNCIIVTVERILKVNCNLDSSKQSENEKQANMANIEKVLFVTC